MFDLFSIGRSIIPAVSADFAPDLYTYLEGETYQATKNATLLQDRVTFFNDRNVVLHV
jgi:hypothetical protein